MNETTRKALFEFILDHVYHFGAMPMDFEDVDGKIWGWDACQKELDKAPYLRLACNQIINLKELQDA